LKKIRYTDHLKVRLRVRGIPRSLPRVIYAGAKSKYRDVAAAHFIALGRAPYGGKERLFIVAYDITGDGVEIVTIHPISRAQVESRVKSGRWVKYEE